MNKKRLFTDGNGCKEITLGEIAAFPLANCFQLSSIINDLFYKIWNSANLYYCAKYQFLKFYFL